MGEQPGGGAHSTVITDIGELVTNSKEWGSGLLGLRHDAAVVIEDGTVAWIGGTRDAPAADRRISARGRSVIPGFVDSHSHIVFAGNRAEEFGARMSGHPYTAGGIMSTVKATRSASDDYLRTNAIAHLDEMMRQGTTTVEIKSGYGLTTKDEERCLRIAAGLTDEVTYLGAHVVPAEFDGAVDRYVDLVVGEMLDACAPHARWVDVFVEDGAFGADEAREILTAGKERGLLARVHANQLGPGPGVQVACETGAASADHCTHLSPADVEALATSGVVATLLPGAEFSTRAEYPSGRNLIDAGVTVAIATDCNPGSSYTSSMSLMIALSVRECHLTPEEALWAATAGGAAALLRSDVGHLGVGARADLSILSAPSHVYIPYRPGVDQVDTVMHDGVLVDTRRSASGASPRL